MIRTESVTRLILTAMTMWTLCNTVRLGWTYHKEGKLFGFFCSLGYAVNLSDDFFLSVSVKLK